MAFHIRFDSLVSILDGLLLMIVFQQTMSKLRHLQVMLHWKLLMVVRLQLLGQILIISDLHWTDKEARLFLALLEREHKLEDGIFRPLLLLTIHLIILLLYQSVTESLSHLHLSLPTIVLVILCTLDICPDDLLFHVQVSLVIILSPLLTL